MPVGCVDSVDGVKKYGGVWRCGIWKRKKKKEIKWGSEFARDGEKLPGSLVSHVWPECKWTKGARWQISQQMTICLIFFLQCMYTSFVLPSALWLAVIWPCSFAQLSFPNKISRFSFFPFRFRANSSSSNSELTRHNMNTWFSLLAEWRDPVGLLVCLSFMQKSKHIN